MSLFRSLRIDNWRTDLLIVRLNCCIKANLRHLPESRFTHRTRPSDGVPYVSVSYNLVVENNQSGLMTFSIEADGKEYAAVEAMY